MKNNFDVMATNYSKEKSILSDNDRSYILENYHNTTVQEMRLHLNKHSHTVYDFMSDKNLDIYIKPKVKRNSSVPDGYFDVHEKENWAI